MRAPLARACALLLGVTIAPGKVAAQSTEGTRPDLPAVARSSERPEECGGSARVKVTRWERARVPGLTAYCDALAKGFAALGTAPDTSVAQANAAEAALPGHAAPLVLRARANAALGQSAEAWADFEKARSLGAAHFDAPRTLHALAVVALETGHPSVALDALRALVPRISLLDDRAEATRVLIEAGVLCMTSGTDHLAEAIGYFTEARRGTVTLGLRDALAGAFALAESRAGRNTEALALAAEASGPWRLEAARDLPRRSDALTLPVGEMDAMIALLAEKRDHDLSVTRYESYLGGAGKDRPYAASARARLQALGHSAKASP
jgi:hypothetical protein